LYKEFFGHQLYQWGIYPRTIHGLKGIIFSPFIHGDWGHLIFNMMPFFTLGLIIYYFYPRVAGSVMVMIFIITGISVWGFARYNYHIGASGLVYGMLAFVGVTGILRRNVKSIILSLIVLFFYQGFFNGLIPKEGVSWESHLYGALAGAFAAYFYKNYIEEDEEKTVPSWELEQPQEGRYFLPRDIFEKTKAQRLAEQNPPPGEWTQDHT